MYCGLALHHAKLYDKIRRSEQKNKVNLHITAARRTANKPIQAPFDHPIVSVGDIKGICNYDSLAFPRQQQVRRFCTEPGLPHQASFFLLKQTQMLPAIVPEVICYHKAAMPLTGFSVTCRWRWKCSPTLQRQNTESSKQIFPERNIGVSVPISTFMDL